MARRVSDTENRLLLMYCLRALEEADDLELLRFVSDGGWMNYIELRLGLAALTVTRDGETHTWRLTRTERVLPNNDLATDAAGRTLMDVTVARDGEEAPWSAFEAAYQSLLGVTVSGRLPEGWAPEEGAEPTAVYTFLSVTGDRHTVSLLPFDALHDAVAIDGGCVFYLIRGGMSFEP